MPKKVGTDTFRAQVLEAQRPVVAEFYADGCVPCRRLAPILSALEEEYAETVDFVKINTGANEALTQTYGILASPTLILFRDGAEQARLRGAVKKPELIKWIGEQTL